MLLRQVRGKILARRGELVEAQRLLGEALALGDDTDMLAATADARFDLAAVLAAAGRVDAAAIELQAAEELYRAKGYTVGLERARTKAAELQAATT